MRRMQRIVLMTGLLALAPVLVGCENFDMDKLDVFGLTEKKKLPGDRKAVFPEGVPGVSQGIPPEYVKGNQPPPDTAQTVPGEPDNKAAATEPTKKTAAIAPVEEPKPKPKPKRKPKPRVNISAPVQPPAQSQSGAQALPPAWPTQSQQQPPQQAGSGPSSNTAPWPSAPAPGTFSR
jgi:hypothetical protein